MIPVRLLPHLAATLTVLAGILLARSHWIGIGEDRIRAQIAEQREQIEAKYAALRTEDSIKNATLSNELALIRADYAELRDRPPVVLTQTREVRVSESCTCPAVSLGAGFLQDYNRAARNP